MTREEAIGNLNMIRVAFIDTVTPEQGRIIDDTFIMAREALRQEPCEDAISRQAVLDIVDSYSESQSNVEDVTQDIISDIVALPPVNPQPTTGHWITKPHIYGVAFCSECDFELRIDDTKYCPNCGAKMVEPQESEDKE